MRREGKVTSVSACYSAVVLLCCKVLFCYSVTLLCRWEDADEDSQQTKPQQPRHIPRGLLATQLAISVCCSSALLLVTCSCTSHAVYCLLTAAAAAHLCSTSHDIFSSCSLRNQCMFLFCSFALLLQLQKDTVLTFLDPSAKLCFACSC